ncbi:LamG-like jellyroll fold domain-containing protein [Cypionkella sp. TWP1-2-1b2]|uniref:LamG-like jellyroll fold domain-containing protein n=1 Tax=Cypionkella sp. TWP1-2-1b2 TaxID=2804675 RepID=UPI003CF408A7
MNFGFGLSLTAQLMGSGGGGGGGAPLSVMRGYQPSMNMGTTGDKFVSPTGSNANAGTIGSPYLTIEYAMTQITAGQHIKVRAGKYRPVPSVSFSGKGGTVGARTKVSGYGTEQVIVTAAEALTGWTQCAAGDSTVLGSVLGVASSPVYKKTVAKSTIASSDPRAAFPFENGVKLNPCMAKLPAPQFPQYESVTADWQTATTTVTSLGLVTGFRLASMTSLYTTAQIQNADVYFHAYPNVNYRTKVASFGAGTDAVANTINLTDQTQTYETNTYKDRFALINILPQLKAGEWGFTDDDATNCTLYIYPTSAANMTANIEYSARGKVIDRASESHCEVAGLIIERASSAGVGADGLYNIAGAGSGIGFVVDNCLVRHGYRANRSYTMIHMGNVSDVVIRQTTIQDGYNQGAIFLQGGEWNGTGMASGNRIDRCLIERMESSPIRTWGQTLCVVSWTSCRDCGVTAHANKASVYASSHKVLYWGCDWRSCSGYWTFQECSSIVAAFCDIPVTYISDNVYAINDQNSATAGQQSPATEQSINGDSYFLNCITAPFRDTVSATTSIALGITAETAVLFTAKNNIFHGATGASSVDQSKLKAGGWKNNFLSSGVSIDASDTVNTNLSLIYNDVMNGDTSIKAGSPTLSAATASIAADIAVLAGWFPDFASQMAYDISGAAFNSATPPMGPYVNALSPLAVPMIWIERPTISGTPTSGTALSLVGGYRVGYPFAAQTQQWVRSTTRITGITNISGQTGTSYTPDAANADVGYYIGCDVTSGGVTTRVWSSLQVVAAVAFAARGAYFDSADNLRNGSSAVTCGSNGLMSFWIKSDDTAWNASARTIFSSIVGSTIVCSLSTTTTGRLTFRLNNDTATDTATFFSATGSVQFAIATWYHIMIAWTASGATIYVNGASVATMTFASVDMSGANITSIAFGSNTIGTSIWKGDLAHFWFSTTQTLDITNSTNRAKFVSAGVPVNQGGNGAIPTGTVPEFYLDGAGAAWSNQGTGGALTVTGALTASSTTPSY